MSISRPPTGLSERNFLELRGSFPASMPQASYRPFGSLLGGAFDGCVGLYRLAQNFALGHSIFDAPLLSSAMGGTQGVHQPHAVVFIDSRAPDIQTLLNGLKPGEQAFVIDSQRDGLQQIVDILKTHHLTDLSAIQIVSHGSQGQIQLGSTALNDSQLAGHAHDLASIGAALSAKGDLMLYACNTGAGAAGAQFVADLSHYTHADVAAASHFVGGAAQGGSWDLDVNAGHIETSAPFTQGTLDGYTADLTGITGQLWFTTLDIGSKNVVGYLNSDGSTIAQVGTPSHGTAYSIAVDTAAGYYFVGNTDHLTVSCYRISTNALVETLQVGDDFGTPTGADDELVCAVAVDPINHILFVNRWDSDLDHTGIVKITYNPATGDLNNNGAFNSGSTQFLLTGTSTGGNYTNGTNFEIDIATHKLYYTDTDNQYSFAPFSPTNAIYVVSDYTAASPTVTKLTSQIQFPTNDSNGFIGNIAVDDAKGLIYFTTLDYTDPGQGHIWYMSIAGGTATKIMDLDNMHLGDSIPAGLSLDPVNQQLYINQAYYDPPAGGPYPNAPTANANHVLVYQLSADGHSFSSLVANYTLNQLEGQTPTDTGSHPGGSVWNQLPTLSVTGTTTHAGEQGADIGLPTSFTSADADGGFYSSATVQITGGTFSSNENSTADDHLFVLDGITHRISGTYTGTSITISYDTATEKLTLSGYDTIAHYNTVMAALHYNTTGDNPTNYGSNTTRTLTWTVSDGSQNVPAGNQNSGTTSITIDAVNDAPVSTITPLTYAATEQVDLSLKNNGLAVSDVDGLSGTVTLSVTEGTLTVTSGTSGAGVAGSGTSSVTLTGTLAQINALLNTNATSTVIYNDGSDTPSASATLTLQINDGGNTGSGGALSASDTATINITAVNDAPVAVITPTTYGPVNEQTALDIKNTGMSVSDVDALGGNETVTLSVTEGVLNVTAGTSGALVTNSGTSSVTISGTLAQINALLNTDGGSTVSFTDTLDAPAASVTLTLQINDNGNTGIGGSLTGSDTASIGVTAVNDAPVSTITPTTYSASEQINLSLKANGLAVSDPDGLSGSETVTLSVTEGVLNVAAGTSGAGVAGSGTNTVTITGTIAQINALLNTDGTSTVGFIDNTDTPGASSTLTLLIHDNGNTGTGGDLFASDSATINITAVNDAPVATTPVANYSATEQVALDLKNTGMSVSDVDALGGSETVTLSVTEGVLNVTAGTSGALVTNSGTSSVTITGTLAQINALLNTDGTSTVSYIDNNDAPAASATLTLQVDDNGNTGTGGSLSDSAVATIDITGTDDPPVVHDDAFGPISESSSIGASVFADNGSGADTDPDGPPLSVSEVNGSSGDVGTPIVLASGAHLTLNSDGTFVYDPFGAFDYLPAAGSGASNLTATDSFTYKLTGGGTATVTITISGLDSDDTLIGTAGNDTMDGGIGADIFLVGQGGADTVQGGDGDDTFRFGSRLTAADQVTGGTGDDRIILNGNYSGGVVFGATTMSGVESIRLIDGNDYTLTTNDANVAAGETLGVFGGTLGAGDDLTFDGSAETDGRFEIHAGAGTDTLTGGAGSDDFLFMDTFTAADKVNGGGGGDDRLILNGDYSGGVVFGATTMTGIETIRLTSGHDYTLTTNDANVAADKTLAVRGSTLVSGDNLIFDGSAETNGKFDLHGGAGADTLKSGAKADALDGGAGVDALTGGSGRDTFTFHIGEAAGDTITDFDGNGANPGDRIEFVGYGVGATFNQINATQWEVVSGDTLTHEIINFSNSAVIDASDYTFI